MGDHAWRSSRGQAARSAALSPCGWPTAGVWSTWDIGEGRSAAGLPPRRYGREAGARSWRRSMFVTHLWSSRSVRGSSIAKAPSTFLVNAAAINLEMSTPGMDDETWREVLATNLDGAFHLCREAAKYMVLGRWGRIVNVSSISASRGGRGQANYAASKAGVESLTHVLALELGRKGVLANCVAPGSSRLRCRSGSVASTARRSSLTSR